MADLNVQPTEPMPESRRERAEIKVSRLGRLWVSLVVSVILLVLLLIFIAQNSTQVKIHYLGFNGTIGFGVAMLLAAVIGAILTILIGSARILQLKLEKRNYVKENR